MKEMLLQFEKLQAEAAECALIAKLATDRAKRELFARLAEHYNVLAGDVQNAISRASSSS